MKSWMEHDAAWATGGTDLKKEDLVREASENEAYFRNTLLQVFGNSLSLAIRVSQLMA